MSVVYGLSVCMAKCNFLLLGMKIIYLDCFLWVGSCVSSIAKFFVWLILLKCVVYVHGW